MAERFIGAFEAKTRLSALLEEVARGARIAITKRGRPIAMLVPPGDDPPEDTAQIIKAMTRLRKGTRLGRGLSVRDLAREGRR